MRNLKKVLALVVAVAMIASMGLVASAATFTDVASNASYADAVNLLSNLGVITGYEDGTFQPDKTVTRAEAATMMVRLLGLADGVEKGDTAFTDVDGSHWASGYINVAVANGIVNGMGDGTFAPEATLTYGQIVKMIVCALGYEPVATANGGWLGGGYLVAGSKAGFTKGVNGTADAAASRATVALLMYKALEVDMMDQESFSTGIAGDTYKVIEGKTILSEYLELEKVEGVIISTYLSDTEYEEGDNTVSLVITKNYAEDEYYEVGETIAFVADGTSAATLLGYSVVAYVGENEDGDDEMFAVAAKAGKNEVITLDTGLIKRLDADTVVYYKSETSKNTTEAAIDNVITFKNVEDVEVEYNVVVNGFVDYADIFESWEDLEEVTLLDNDGDGDFEFIFATKPTADAIEFVVEETDVEDYVITGTEDEDLTLDYENTDMIITIVKDGAIVEFDAIAEGDVVTCLDTTVNVLTIYVSSTVIDGMIDEVEDDVFTINNKEYKVSPIVANAGTLTADDLAAGDDGKFYINAMGKIVAVDTVSSIVGANYVYIIAAEYEEGTFGDGEGLVKLVTSAGAVEVLTVKSKKVDVVDAEGTSEDLTDEEVIEALGSYTGIARIKTDAAGEISVVYLPGSEDFEVDDRYDVDPDDQTKYYNAARGTYGALDIEASTLVFHHDTTEEDLEDAITVTTVGDLFVDESSYKFVAYGNEDEIEVLVAEDAKAAVDAEAPVMVVTKIVKTTADDEATWKITGIMAGETVSVVVDPDEADSADAIVKGNVILFAKSAGYATDLAVLFTSDDEAAGELGSHDDILKDELTDESVTMHYGLVTDKKSTKTFTIEGVDEAFYYAEDVNYIVVDYSYANVSIKVGSKSDIKASSVNPVSVFVKTAADEADVVTDVVIFKGL